MIDNHSIPSSSSTTIINSIIIPFKRRKHTRIHQTTRRIKFMCTHSNEDVLTLKKIFYGLIMMMLILWWWLQKKTIMRTLQNDKRGKSTFKLNETWDNFLLYLFFSLYFIILFCSFLFSSYSSFMDFVLYFKPKYVNISMQIIVRRREDELNGLVGG